MPEDLCIRLPFLHPQINHAHERAHPFTNLSYLWIGHAPLKEASVYWQPDNLPLSFQEAGFILSSLKTQDLAELQRMRLLMEQRLHEKDKRFRAEMTELENFLNSDGKLSPENCQDLDQTLREAQLALLWIWYLEEESLEIETLTRHCESAEVHLLDQVLEMGDNEIQLKESFMNDSASMLTDWKKVLLNAAFFIPPSVPILLEGVASSSLMENFNGTLSNKVKNLLAYELPLWRVVGLSKSGDKFSPLAGYWNDNRKFYLLQDDNE